MHICHVNLAKGFSGGERQTLNLIRTLARRGEVRQSAVIRADSPLNQHLADLDVTIIHINHHLTGHLRRRLPKGTLLHAHDGKAVYWCALQNLLHGNPYVITRRVDNPLKSNRLTRMGYSRAQRVVCLSRAIAAQVAKLSGEIATSIIPSSYSAFEADADKVADIRRQFPEKVIVGQVGKLIHHKGYQLTIEAASRLGSSHPQMQFIFLGAGADEQELKAQAKGLDNVRFLGHQAEVGHYLAAMDLMVFPSLNEGLGSTVLEAWQHGTPVIGSDAGGIPDMIEDGVTGLLVPAGDSQALEQAIVRLAGDAELQTRLASGAKTRLADFTPQSVAQRYQALYHELLS
ncbi:glycosyltransferase family 4 protein [Ferrimonas sp.]|uniref:glycosyltransferase family 4 protein n=1 Tax=Ferrimonas sp. TaxID=2080861 RepID=UPI003A8CE8D4